MKKFEAWEKRKEKILPVVKKKLDKILLVIAAGLVILLICIPMEQKESMPVESPQGAGVELEEKRQEDEARLEQLLNKLLQSQEVEVMITYKSTEERVVNKDVEYDATSRRETSVLDDDSQPYVVRENMAVVEGVVIVTGPISITMEKEISEGVQALFGLEAHKIKILKKES